MCIYICLYTYRPCLRPCIFFLFELAKLELVTCESTVNVTKVCPPSGHVTIAAAAKKADLR